MLRQVVIIFYTVSEIVKYYKIKWTTEFRTGYQSIQAVLFLWEN
jgi:hypothetical protein